MKGGRSGGRSHTEFKVNKKISLLCFQTLFPSSCPYMFPFTWEQPVSTMGKASIRTQALPWYQKGCCEVKGSGSFTGGFMWNVLHVASHGHRLFQDRGTSLFKIIIIKKTKQTQTNVFWGQRLPSELKYAGHCEGGGAFDDIIWLGIFSWQGRHVILVVWW